MEEKAVKSRLEKAAAEKAELEAQIKDLQKDITEIDKGQAEATKIRMEEKAEYEKAAGDFKSYEDACAQAVAVLKNYYEGASFMQVSSSTQRAGSRARQTGDGSQIIEFLMF